MKAYLDIETSFCGEITVIGVFCPPDRVRQLVGEEVNWTNLWNALEGVSEILTYNGARFDLPVIKRHVKLDLNKYFQCRDLMYDCWKRNLYGGLRRWRSNWGSSGPRKGSMEWRPCGCGSGIASMGMEKPCKYCLPTTGMT